MNLEDVSDAALLKMHRDSIEQREASFRPGFPVRARDQRIERHNEIVGEMLRRRLTGAPLWNRRERNRDLQSTA